MNKPLSDDEFDIEVMAEKVWRLNKRFWSKIFFPLRMAFANTKNAIVALVIALVLAFAGKYLIPPTYKSTFVIAPTYPVEYAYIGMLDDLRTLIKDDNYPYIAKQLKLPEATCEKLVNIKTNIVYKNKILRDTIILVEISLFIKQADLIDTFQNAIIDNYLNGSPYYTKLHNIRKRELAALELRLVNDLKENDSLKKVVVGQSFPRNGGGFVYGEPLDPLRTYQSGIDLFQQYISLKSQQEFTYSFVLVKPGIIRLKPHYTRMVILLPIAVFLCLLFCMITNIRQQKIR